MKAKNSILSSVIALVCCFAMLLGTTLAWFTDTAFSTDNVIRSGSLKVDMLHKVGDEWISIKDNPSHKIFNYAKWEPGYTRVETVKVESLGTLALQYRISIAVQEGSETLGENGESLADVIQVYVSYSDNAETSFDAIKNSDSWSYKGTLAEVIEAPKSFIGGQLLPAGEALPADAADTTAVESQTVSIALHMKDGAGNGYQGLDVGNLRVELSATQWSYEMDSFDNTYDSNATFPSKDIEFYADASVANKVENSVLTGTVTVGDLEDVIYATVPAGVKLTDGATALALRVNTVKVTQSNVTATHRSEVVHSVDVHMEGVAEDNTVPMIIVLDALLPAGLNDNNVCIYHVEGGETVAMTLVEDPVNHNEFSYDPVNGNVVMALASFSEVVLYGDTVADWDGAVAKAFAGGTGTEADPYLIANASQLAYFRDQVDGGRTFEGQFVKLTSSINLSDINFDPIGWGYDYDGFTAGGKTFNGTFDGGNFTIFGLYQNGWDLDPDKENYSNYTYSMAGGGLFASVVDATIKNLTISGADIVFECVDMGVIVGYAQGNCTFDNISIINCTIQNYNRYTGGVVGECSPRYNADGTPMYSNHVFNNINVDSTTTVSSLWGSFDTSLGGILGGKWDKNGAETKVTMTNCHVACTIDTFNDVTSAYQWYAYRRSGMLIGNTEQSADHAAKADFLTCENVYVYYGEWNNYHYCEFTNQSGSDNADWQNNYPWVRVESGLSCGAYSNPRYGHPIINGTAVVDSIHSHQAGDDCMISLPFAQLYGGGQGVYGATEHAGVSEGSYTVTYMDEETLLKVEFVDNNSSAHTLWSCTEYKVGNESPQYWADASGTQITSVSAGNIKHIVVYPKWKNEFTIRFVDAEGNVLYYENFTRKTSHTLNTEAINDTLAALQNKVDATKKTVIVSWDRDNLTTISSSEATKDITVKAIYTIKDTVITLEPVKDTAGNIIGYAVTKTQETDLTIEIPAYVGVYPVIRVEDNAFAGFDNLHCVTIPTTVTYLGSNALASDWGVLFDSGESMTIYYAGSYQEWQDNMTFGDGWADGISEDTRIFFLNGGDSVDFTQGYLQAKISGSWNKSVSWTHTATVPDSFVSEYYKNCNCTVSSCKGNLRPDAKYWAAYVN